MASPTSATESRSYPPRRSAAGAEAEAVEIRGGGGSGSGGGFALGARPVGAYVIDGEQVRWEPAVDVTRIVLQLTFAALGVAFLIRRGRG